jgi:hypothetical protein
VAGKDRI